MSRCYCAEIESCRNDINSLEHDMECIRECDCLKIRSALTRVQWYATRKLYIESESPLTSRILALYEDLEAARQEALEQIEERIDELEEELDDMIEEDDAYHEEEDEDEDEEELLYVQPQL